MSAAKKKQTMGQKRAIYCVLNGHTPITEYCFGYHSCARCDEQLGDSLGGAYRSDSNVYVSHIGQNLDGCNCLANARALKRKDRALVPAEILKALDAALAATEATRAP